jgi:hypothetical protein
MRMMTTVVLAGVILAAGAVPAQPTGGYEKEPVFKASDLVPPELLKGPHFTVDSRVPVKGFLERFTIRSPYATFEAHGRHMLAIRVNEMEAIGKLEDLSKTKEFAQAAGRAIARPVTSTESYTIAAER